MKTEHILLPEDPTEKGRRFYAQLRMPRQRSPCHLFLRRLPRAEEGDDLGCGPPLPDRLPEIVHARGDKQGGRDLVGVDFSFEKSPGFLVGVKTRVEGSRVPGVFGNGHLSQETTERRCSASGPSAGGGESVSRVNFSWSAISGKSSPVW